MSEPTHAKLDSPVAELVRRIMVVHGLKQEDVARRADMRQAKVSRWSRGFVPDSADEVIRLQQLERVLDAEKAARKALKEPVPVPVPSPAP